MSAASVNDKFIQLMREKEPVIFNKIKDAQFGIVKLANEQYQAFFSASLSAEDNEKLHHLFQQAIAE